MNRFGSALSLSIIAGLVAMCGVGQAQTPPPDLTSSTSTTFKPSFSTSIGVYPYAQFAVAGHQGSTYGGLFAAETTYSFTKTRDLSLGGWYWMANAGNSLYEVHLSTDVTPQISLRGGYLFTSDEHGFAWDGFALYNISLHKQLKRPANIQLGPGIFIDPTGGHSSMGFSGSINASYEIGRNLRAVGYYWYANDQGNGLHRIMFGLNKRL